MAKESYGNARGYLYCWHLYKSSHCNVPLIAGFFVSKVIGWVKQGFFFLQEKVFSMKVMTMLGGTYIVGICISPVIVMYL